MEIYVLQRNRELIGKYAMKDLVSRLPRADQRLRDPSVSDATIGAILGILFETVKHSADFTRFLISLDSHNHIFKY